MTELEKLRTEIDAIDRELGELLIKRMDAAKRVAAEKLASGQAIEDPEREEAMLKARIEALSGEGKLNEEQTVRFYRTLIEMSKDVQRKEMKSVVLYTDGACRGNPGPGGYGAILRYCDAAGCWREKELSAGYRETTNNRMELLAAIIGLEALKTKCRVELFSDSQYLVKAINEGWMEKWEHFGWYKDAKRKEKAKNADLWNRLSALLKKHQVSFIWVKGHAENEFNNRCDALGVEAALNEAEWLADEVFEAEAADAPEQEEL